MLRPPGVLALGGRLFDIRTLLGVLLYSPLFLVPPRHGWVLGVAAGRLAFGVEASTAAATTRACGRVAPM